jgi:hypothetical protein
LSALVGGRMGTAIDLYQAEFKDFFAGSKAMGFEKYVPFEL